MSETAQSQNAQPQTEELKPHGDELAGALEPTNTGTKADPQPQPAQSSKDTKE